MSATDVVDRPRYICKGSGRANVEEGYDKSRVVVWITFAWDNLREAFRYRKRAQYTGSNMVYRSNCPGRHWEACTGVIHGYSTAGDAAGEVQLGCGGAGLVSDVSLAGGVEPLG